MGDGTRLLIALAAVVTLALLALLTWFAVRIDGRVRRLLPPPVPPPPPPCDRLHVSDLGWHQRLAGEGEPYIVAEDLPAFRSTPRTAETRPYRAPRDEEEANPTFPVPRRR